MGVSLTDVSITSLSAEQAAGTSRILAARGTRESIIITPPADCKLTFASGATTGIKLFADIPNQFSGFDCPTNELFLSGLSEGDAVEIQVAQ